MGQLFFKKPLQDAIREGRKRTTIRRWSRPMVQVGKTAFSPGLGWLSISGVESVDLESLDDNDAIADGFPTIAGLRKVLLDFYPDHAGDGKRWFRVSFLLSKRVQKRGRKRREAPT
jgi:hypothetical protein